MVGIGDFRGYPGRDYWRIYDSCADSEQFFLKQEDGSIVVEGSTLLRDLNRKLNFQFPLDGPKTLNGLILEHFQDIPEAGISLNIANYPMEIIQTKNRVVKMVKIYPAFAASETDELLE